MYSTLRYASDLPTAQPTAHRTRPQPTAWQRVASPHRPSPTRPRLKISGISFKFEFELWGLGAAMATAMETALETATGTAVGRALGTGQKALGRRRWAEGAGRPPRPKGPHRIGRASAAERSRRSRDGVDEGRGRGRGRGTRSHRDTWSWGWSNSSPGKLHVHALHQRTPPAQSTEHEAVRRSTEHGGKGREGEKGSCSVQW
ncbi:hypothetical protein BZA05DRAFT_88231 [Tricharina praecox]|uniref:uncharacterized protein n=1 Tax=Tricharina praecox TaxID=43433 RepID=UPI00221F1124|nr:uncharacterized protein BZA05DRAFT_88231 [Tricharina praecox]KAI5848835.1 hypothetical protein BZA05DRAFT_88231 [Tricharina praecox]